MATNFSAQIISHGRITIPQHIRDKLGIKEGDHVQVGDLKKLVPVEEKKTEAA